jgi:hypothetical protein
MTGSAVHVAEGFTETKSVNFESDCKLEKYTIKNERNNP